MKFERNEYPRPQFRRDEWLPLNGEWEFEFDDGKTGVKRGIYRGQTSLNGKINVPFSYRFPPAASVTRRIMKLFGIAVNLPL